MRKYPEATKSQTLKFGKERMSEQGSGVFGSSDGLRQFRMDTNSLLGKHDPWNPHIHLEAFKPNSKYPYVNNHIFFYE